MARRRSLPDLRYRGQAGLGADVGVDGRCASVDRAGGYVDELEAVLVVDGLVDRLEPQRLFVADPSRWCGSDEPEGSDEEHGGLVDPLVDHPGYLFGEQRCDRPLKITGQCQRAQR
jgi:hypothetical protein